MSRLDQYGVFFNGKHSYHDLGLIAVSPLFFNSTTIKEKKEEITGANNSLDYTDALNGHPDESSITGEWKFISLAENPYDVLNKIMWLNGSLVNVTLSDDTSLTKSAWISIKEVKSDGVKTDVTISYEVINV